MPTVFTTEHNDKLVVCIVFHGDGLERVRNHDPAVVQGADVQQSLKQAFAPPLPMVDVFIAYEEDEQAFQAKCQGLGSTRAIMRYLARNWTNLEGEPGPPIKLGTVQP